MRKNKVVCKTSVEYFEADQNYFTYIVFIIFVINFNFSKDLLYDFLIRSINTFLAFCLLSLGTDLERQNRILYT